uniref:NADH dehydrogenase subunit 6 n=1 Tax=Arisubathynella cheongmiensis TaxID=2025387 RepID=A0A7R6D7A2_9CRUS|nr:NADH dehydrogenase subunit 6 [Arisubathynella cheongmiensis]
MILYILFMSCISMLLEEPISFGLILMNYIIFCCFISYKYWKISWLFYLVFLIFMGGLLILLLYVSALSFNQFLMIKKEEFSLIMISLFMIFLINKIFEETMIMENNYNLFEMLSMLYNHLNLLYFMFMYLLLVLLPIGEMINKMLGALRKFN